MSLFVPLDVTWMDNLKVLRVGLAGAGLHAMAMCLAKRTETDGLLHRVQLYRLGADDTLIDLLISEGLFDPVEYGTRSGEDPDKAYVIAVHDWHDRNPSQGAIDATRNAKKGAAREGNHRRWKHAGDVADCPICNPETPRSSHPAIANRRSASPQGSPETETETETDTCDRQSDHTTAAAAGATRAPDDFPAFWAAYPRKTNRQKASQAWRRMTKTDRAAANIALPAHIAAWKTDHPDTDRYIPHAATWLNGRRWEDDLAPRNGHVTARVDTTTGAQMSPYYQS